ncbi:hypothetical protein [Kutzneria albida]|uniref:Uncharacterized protein n=1 Tax=Kutzneria albida DSM 43870 TaxID=1449976 RepID=W5WK29_9PSEU|nr:hypothetical protein [Kutzneria albida]AHH98534.1 hypothetical protein KALB_5172 [Kutzneria albida DSM 43870]
MPAGGEVFIDHMCGGESPIVVSTARPHEVAISLFLDFLLNCWHGWAPVCEEWFGDRAQAVFCKGDAVPALAGM